MPFLSILIWLPVVGALLVLCCAKHHFLARALPVLVGLVSLAFCIWMYVDFDTTTYHLQFVENILWIKAYHIHYALGVDGISFLMVMLTVFTSVIVTLAAGAVIKQKLSQYMAALLILQGMMIGVFAASDAILFYVFWEAMLIPMYICMGGWGMEQRRFVSVKFFLYSFFGSVLMLVALLYLSLHAGSFAIADLYGLNLPLTVQIWIFLAFLLAFAVKLPMWPLHTWLPDAHADAPAGGSVILAILMLKMGVYGFLRFSLPIAPMAAQTLSWLMIVLALIAIVYIGLIALAQNDIKRLIAYSSISHMGIAVLGAFIIYPILAQGSYADAYLGFEGATVQMIAHAFSSGALFLGCGFLYERLHTRYLSDLGGIASKMPVFAAFFMLFAMSNVGLPGTAGFVGEFMVIIAAFKANVWVALIAASTLVIAAAYTLWMYARIFFGKVVTDGIHRLTDIAGVEWLIFCVLAFATLAIGLYPEWILTTMHASLAHLLSESLAFNPKGM